MAKALVCIGCGYQALQWRGRCPECGAWDSFNEPRSGGGAPLVFIDQIRVSSDSRLRSGIGEFDRVLGGGLVPGSVVLLAGPPGIGKSTLCLQAAAGFRRGGHRVVLMSGEEALEQVAARAARVGSVDGLEAAAETGLGAVIEHMGNTDVLLIDSVQTLRDPDSPGEAGSVSQVRASTAAIGRAARAHNTAVLLVGHVTKDGTVAGPKTLEHIVDAVLTFDGDDGQILRTVRSTKNRFGPTSEVGIFEMRSDGLAEVADASGLFLSGRLSDSAGSVVGCVLEGRRAVAVEVQALVSRRENSAPRRIAEGIDGSRLGVMAAVVEKRAHVDLSGFDAYARIAGGLKTADRAIDLPLAIALASSRKDRRVPEGIVALGEVGLGGEIRRVPGTDARLAEAARLGFDRALVPPGTASCRGIRLETVADLNAAVEHLM